jgi:hypothetical protein
MSSKIIALITFSNYFVKNNKTCLGRFQDCGRGKGKNMLIFMAKVEE